MVEKKRCTRLGVSTTGCPALGWKDHTDSLASILTTSHSALQYEVAHLTQTYIQRQVCTSRTSKIYLNFGHLVFQEGLVMSDHQQET